MESLVSSLIRVPHGFLGRKGGVSSPPYDSLNTSFSVGDDPLAVTDNLVRIAHIAGVHVDQLLTVNQVHGANVVHSSMVTGETDADAVWTNVSGMAVGVRTADCVPLLIEDPKGRVAAVHAGWRGVMAKIAARTIEQLIAQGGKVDEFRVAVGPCIQKCCFEVDGDLPARFSAEFGADVVHPAERGKARLDLPLAVLHTLENVGLTRAQIEVFPHCTRCDSNFFSHRREKGTTGRQLSFITCEGASGL